MGVYKNDNGTLELISGATLWADAPIGCIQAYGGATAPDGWLICNGAAVSRTTYAALFAVVGTSFGAGDGTTTFNLPDMTGKTAMGVETGHALGASEDGALPNITGKFGGWRPDTSPPIASGAFANGTNSSSIGNTAAGSSISERTFDASRSSLIYKDGQTKVDPANVRVNYIIKAQQVAVPADFAGAAEAAGTAAAEEVVAQKVTKFSGTDSGNTYVTVDQLAYDQTNKTLGLKVNGADTVIPFKKDIWTKDAVDRKIVLFAEDTYRMQTHSGASAPGIMAVDSDYFEVVSRTIHPSTRRIIQMVIKPKKNFTILLIGGFYNGTFGFNPLYPTTSSIAGLNSQYDLVAGTSYTFDNKITSAIDNASACCFGVVVSE